MIENISAMIQRYLDNELADEEQETLSQWIRAADENAREFSSAVLLHDRLRDELAGLELAYESEAQPISQDFENLPVARWNHRSLIWATTAALLLMISFLLWQIFSSGSVSAAVELNRIIAASTEPSDRVFSISVEETALPGRKERRLSFDPTRPPKPSIDGAMLHLRGSNQFVLKRRIDANQFFITGCNGKTSWAVRPGGPVRASEDLTRFARDLPGHEHAMPLNNLHDGLEQLRNAYRVSVLSAEVPEMKSDLESDTPSRLLVAVKRRGFRGPQRIEISYTAATGQIEQIRFVDMPYGPERLTIRLTLIEERDLGALFFDHESHHEANRVVEFE